MEVDGEEMGDCLVNRTACLYFRINTDYVLSRIRPHDPEAPSQSMNASDRLRELSLRKLLARTDILYKEKAIVAAILAHSLVPLFGTAWLAENWTLDDVSVFCDEDQGSMPNINLRKPYITSNLETARQRAQQRNQPSETELKLRNEEFHALHHRPQLIRLAILLMELLLGDRAGPFYATHSKVKEWRQSRRSGELWFAAHQMKIECLKRYSARHVFLVVVNQCLEHTAFMRKPGEVWYDDYTDPKILRFIYRRIIWPLEDELLQDLKDTTKPGSDPNPKGPTLGELQNELVKDSVLLAETSGPPIFSDLRFNPPRAPYSASTDIAAKNSEPTGYELEDMDEGGTTDEDRKAQ